MTIRGNVGGLGDTSTATATSITATFAAASVGDAAIVAVSTNNGTDNFTTPSGWVVLGASPYTQSGNLRVFVFGKTALTSGEISGGVAFGGVTGGRLVGNGVILVGPVADFGNVTAVTFAEAQGAVATLTAPSITTKQGLDDCVLLGFARLATASSHSALTLPAAWTKQNEKATNLASSPNYTATAGYLTTPVAAGSSVGGGSITTSPSALQMIAVVVEIMAAVAAPLASGTGQAFAPTVSGGASVSPPLASGTGQAFAPTVSGQRQPTVSPPLATATGQAFAPSVSGGATVSPPTATATGQAFAPAVTGGAQVAPPTAGATGQAFAPTVSGGAVVAPPLAQGQGVAYPPTVSGVQSATVLVPEVATATGQAFAPTVTGQQQPVVAPPVAQVTGQAFAPDVSAGATVDAELATASGQAFAPTVQVFSPRTLTLTAATAPGRFMVDPVPDRWTLACAPDRFALIEMETAP